MSRTLPIPLVAN